MHEQDAGQPLSGDEQIGMVVYVFDKGLKTRHIAEVYGFYVKASHRGEGVGTRLLERALSLIQRNRRTIKVRLAVNPEQRVAVKMYKKAGSRYGQSGEGTEGRSKVLRHVVHGEDALKGHVARATQARFMRGEQYNRAPTGPATSLESLLAQPEAEVGPRVLRNHQLRALLAMVGVALLRAR